MNQEALFPDVASVPARDRKLAIEADVAAAGGLQVVGHDLGLSDDPESAGKLLSNKINENGRHRLTGKEEWQIRQLARQRSGRSRLHELESELLNFDGRWLTSDDIKARRKKRKAVLLAELIELEKEDE